MPNVIDEPRTGTIPIIPKRLAEPGEGTYVLIPVLSEPEATVAVFSDGSYSRWAPD